MKFCEPEAPLGVSKTKWESKIVFWAEGITDAKTLEEGREQDIFKDL
jgi:hypothetical protein